MENIVFEVNDLINQSPEYVNATIKLGMVPMFLAMFPLTYLIPTVYVILVTMKVYLKNVVGKKDETINSYVMFTILAHEISTFGYMLSDYANFRIPSTGLITAWCARQEPSRLLIVIYSCSIYFTYLSMMFPLLLAILRLIPIYYPTKNSEMSARIVWIATPLILLYPLLYISILIPAAGVCRQYPAPFQFGGAFIHYVHSWRDIRNFPFIMLNATIWFSLAIVANGFLYRKLRKLGNRGQSHRYQTAERTLTLTTLSMMISYLCNTVFLIMYGLFVTVSQWFVLLRPFGNDCDLVVVPWVFYLIHPAFKHKSQSLRKYVSSIKSAYVRNVSN